MAITRQELGWQAESINRRRHLGGEENKEQEEDTRVQSPSYTVTHTERSKERCKEIETDKGSEAKSSQDNLRKSGKK